jgi:NAD(P)H-dependent flavin oxidoreductase YrpB (nitropropane dioxygenase family)
LESDLEKAVSDLQKRVASLEQAVFSQGKPARGLEQKIVEKVDELGTQDLIMLALRQNQKQTKAQIRQVLGDWGKAYGSWFDGGNFSGRLVNKGLVKKDGATDAGEDLFSLTKKGEMEADGLMAKL